MKRKVEINVLDADKKKTGSVAADIFIHGRLLGAISIMEGTKIVQNAEVARRLATAETVSLSDTLKGLEKIKKDGTGKDACGRLLVAVSDMKKETDEELTPVLTRQLFLSAPVSLVSETKKGTADLMRATLTCDDDSIIMVSEEEIANG